MNAALQEKTAHFVMIHRGHHDRYGVNAAFELPVILEENRVKILGRSLTRRVDIAQRRQFEQRRVLFCSLA